MNDPDSYVAQIINRDTVAVRRPEKETLPKLFYKGAHQATLDPLAAKRPEGGLFMWSEQQEGAGSVVSGNPNFNNSSAAALLSYDVAHSIPWDWRVSLYTWTKGIASGVYLVAGLLVLLGIIDNDNSIWLWATPIISGGFLAGDRGRLRSQDEEDRHEAVVGHSEPVLATAVSLRARRPIRTRKSSPCGGAGEGSDGSDPASWVARTMCCGGAAKATRPC